MEIPEELWNDLAAMAQEKFDAALAEVESEIGQMAKEYAARFIDVSDLEGMKLMHSMTGKVINIEVSWDA
jgi:hypothetical protein